MYKNLKKLTIIIPTYNRKKSLKKVIKFWQHIPYIKFIILDGGNKSLNKYLKKNINSQFKYLHFKRSSLSERVFLSHKYIKTKYTILCCDDEFYNPEGLLECVNYLEKNFKASCCMGNLVLGFRKRSLGTIFFKMYPQFSKNFKLKSKNKINRVAEFFSSNSNRPSMYSVIRSRHFKKISKFCKNIDKYKCMDIYELIFDVYLSYKGDVKSIKSFYWYRNKINDVITQRKMNFFRFWKLDSNNKLKKKFIYDVMKLLNNNKIEENLNHIFNKYTKYDYRNLKNIRNKLILKLKKILPKKVYEPIQKKNQKEMYFDEMVKMLNLNNYLISLKTLNKIKNFTK